MTTTIEYVWTNADHKVMQAHLDRAACAGFPQCTTATIKHPDGRTEKLHRCYVTPYGIPVALLKQHKPGEKVSIDLSLSVGGEPGRAARFREKAPWWPKATKPGNAAPPCPPEDGKWIEYKIPAHINDLSALCSHLMAESKVLYPPSIYASPTAPHMLFDYWKNTTYRNATIDSGFSWGTYAVQKDGTSKAGTIKLEAAGHKLGWVLQRVSTLGTLLTAPDLPARQPLITDGIDQEVECYINDLNACTARVHMLQEVTRLKLQNLAGLIARVRAVRAIANESAESSGKPSDGASLTGKLDEVIPKAWDILLHLPARSNARSEDMAADALAATASGVPRKYTLNAGADLKETHADLKRLLLGGEHAEPIKRWQERVVAAQAQREKMGFIRFNALDDQVERYSDALSEAVLAYVDSDPLVDDGDDPDDSAALDHRALLMKELHDLAPESFATDVSQLRGKHVLGLGLSLFGKGGKVTTRSQLLRSARTGPAHRRGDCRRCAGRAYPGVVGPAVRRADFAIAALSGGRRPGGFALGQGDRHERHEASSLERRGVSRVRSW